MPINKLSEENTRNTDRTASGREGGDICPALLNLIQAGSQAVSQSVTHSVSQAITSQERLRSSSAELPLGGAKAADLMAPGLEDP